MLAHPSFHWLFRVRPWRLALVVAFTALLVTTAAGASPAAPFSMAGELAAGATALAVSVPVPPRYVRGTDDRLHINYDLLITNWRLDKAEAQEH
jgi:hypothetical protein